MDPYNDKTMEIKDICKSLNISRPTLYGCVAKTRRGTQWPGGSPFLLCLGRHSKEADDEGDLPGDVSFAHPSGLSLAKHVHHLVAL